MCKEKYTPMITVKEKTENAPAEFIELLTSKSVEVGEEVYSLLQVLSDEVL